MLIRAIVSVAAFWMSSFAVAVAQSQSVHRQHLKWMVPQMGTWTGTATMGDSTQNLEGEVRWMLKRNFVKSHFVSVDGNESLEIIGWDPVNERIQRWTFMHNGVFATSYLSSKTDAQRVWNSNVVTPDGQTLSHQVVVEPTIEKETWSQESKNEAGDVMFKMDLKRVEDSQQENEDSDSAAETDVGTVEPNLEFLNPKVGIWRGEFEYEHAGQSSQLKAVSKISWIVGNRFQLTETRFLRDGTNTGAIWAITGWDPSIGKARSWMATSWGTYSESTLTKLEGTKQEWESVDTSATGNQSTHVDVIKLSTDGNERSVERRASDGRQLFSLKLKRRK